MRLADGLGTTGKVSRADTVCGWLFAGECLFNLRADGRLEKRSVMKRVRGLAIEEEYYGHCINTRIAVDVHFVCPKTA